MKFVIRDDDTSFFTSPGTLRRVYSDIWDKAPITLACIPNIAPDSDALATIPNDISECRRITDNRELIRSLRRKIRRGQIAIAQHGWDHARYKGKPEFEAAPNLAGRIESGRETLEKAFRKEVNVFVPPHGQLSNRGCHAIRRSGMNVVREYGPEPLEVQFHHKWILTYLQMIKFYIQYGYEYRYPRPLNYGTHCELYCHRVSNDTDFKWLRRAFEFIAKHDGVFAISAHAPELDNRGISTIQRIVEYADGKVEFVTADGVFS